MTLLLALTMLAGMDVGNGSRYGYEGDLFDNVGTFACRRTLTVRYGQKGWQKMRNHGVAHRTLPCGTRLGICNPRTGRCTAAYVVDRGPWGALDRNGEWHVRTGPLRPGEHYRGVLDLLPGVYSAIDLQGIEKVYYWPLPDPQQSQASRENRLPPLRSHGPSPYAFYLAPSHRSTPFPPLRDLNAEVLLAGVTVKKESRHGELPPLRGFELPAPLPPPQLLAAVVPPQPPPPSLSPTLSGMSEVLPVNAVGRSFPPLRDASAPQPVETVQSRFGMGRSAKAQPVVPVRLLPANS
ncbi:MAG: hypothetical protein U0787_19525 [Polyangia bacterium]